jgi:hypothetical protein
MNSNEVNQQLLLVLSTSPTSAIDYSGDSRWDGSIDGEFIEQAQSSWAVHGRNHHGSSLKVSRRNTRTAKAVQ